MTDIASFRKRQYRSDLNISRCVTELQELAGLSPTQFRKVRDERLWHLISHHFHGPLNRSWQELVKRHGVLSVGHLPPGTDVLSALPIVTKQFLREADYARLPAVPNREVRMNVLTSGSTGTPLSLPQSYAFSRRAWGDMFIRTLAVVGQANLCREPGYAVCHFTDAIKNTGSFAASSYLAETLPNVVLGSTATPIHAHAALIKERGIRWIAGSPGFFISLAAGAIENHEAADTHSLRVVHSAGAPIDNANRARMMRALGLDQFHRVYASTELGFVGVSVGADPIYVLFSDEYIFEIVDAEGRPVSPGQSGRVLVTVLSSDASPLVRYENGDTARFLGHGGPNRHFMLIDQLSRSLTAFVCDAKLAFDDIADLPKQISAMGIPVTAFQFAKQRNPDGRDRVCIRIESAHRARVEVETAARTALYAHYQLAYHFRCGELPPPSIEIYAPGQLTAGKFKLSLYVDETNQ